MRPRLLVLPVAAVILIALSVWKLHFDPREATRRQGTRAMLLPPPQMTEREPLIDPENRPVLLSRYLSRHDIVLVFFPSDVDPLTQPLLSALVDTGDDYTGGDVVVLAISDALPQQNRKVLEREGELPFLLLSDPAFHMQTKYNMVEEVSVSAGEATGQRRRITTEGVFHISRRGLIEWDAEVTHPQPLEEPFVTVSDLVGEELSR